MRFNSLQFGKAMSAALFVLLLVVVGMKNALAQNLVATLQHGSDISMYYGTNAFVQAHEAAQTGDIITLSSGTFNPTTITKAITLRGAGCCMDTITGIYPTFFSSTLEADVSDEVNSLTIEGISSSFWFYYLENPKFIKCNFRSFDYGIGTCLMQNAQFINCMVCLTNYAFGNNNTTYATNTQFTNCYVEIHPNSCTDETHVSFSNSIVRFKVSSGTIASLLGVNSIFYGNTNSWSNFYTESALFNNCISVHMDHLFDNQTNTSNLEMNYFNDVFETYDGSYINFNNDIFERFILKNSFATSFLGNDGTEVGIHGGQAPYNPRPNYMVLKQCNVAGQSTIDNKLSVEIQVVSEGE